MAKKQGKDIIVDMLGDFTLREQGTPAEDAVKADLTGRSRRLWMIIAYLIINREHGVSAQELIDTFWPDSESGDPLAKLQNNISRARAILADAGFKNAKELLHYGNGIYTWAPDQLTLVDADKLERVAKSVGDSIAPDELDEALAACELYKGGFLENAKLESWCVSLNIYYDSLFIRLAEKTVEALFEADRLDDAERLCLRVIDVNPSAEEFSVYLMRALTSGGNPQKALEHYERMEHTLSETYGISVPSTLVAEREAALQKLYGEAMTAEAIHEFILDDPADSGAFNCTNSVFRDIVKLVLRDMRRTGVPAQLVVISFRGTDDHPEQHAIDVKRIETTLTNALRSGDPFTKMGQDQFLALLPGANEENSLAVIDRILTRFRKSFPRVKMEFKTATYSLDTMLNGEFGL